MRVGRGLMGVSAKDYGLCRAWIAGQARNDTAVMPDCVFVMPDLIRHPRSETRFRVDAGSGLA